MGSASIGSENESEEELMPAAEVEAVVRARLPPFESFSPVSTGSKGDTRLKVHLACLHFEVQERAQICDCKFTSLRSRRRSRLECDSWSLTQWELWEVKLRNQISLELPLLPLLSLLPLFLLIPLFPLCLLHLQQPSHLMWVNTLRWCHFFGKQR